MEGGLRWGWGAHDLQREMLRMSHVRTRTRARRAGVRQEQDYEANESPVNDVFSGHFSQGYSAKKPRQTDRVNTKLQAPVVKRSGEISLGKIVRR